MDGRTDRQTEGLMSKIQKSVSKRTASPAGDVSSFNYGLPQHDFRTWSHFSLVMRLDFCLSVAFAASIQSITFFSNQKVDFDGAFVHMINVVHSILPIVLFYSNMFIA